jgi:hypothetical protein
MAATTFKQQCPSCEAQVPIKDPKLIGRKIDCPKCKYRFVVEEPEEEAAEVAAVGARKNGKAESAVTARRPVGGKGATTRGGAIRDDEDGDLPEKKKSGGVSTVLILGIGLGAVALVLVVVGILAATGVFGSGKSSTAGGSTNTGTNNPGGSGDNKKEPDAPPPLQLSDATNYLPNDTESVTCARCDKVIDSPLGKAAFQTPGAFNLGAFQAKFGFPLESVTQIVSAKNTTQDWVFNVIRTSKPVTEADLTNLNLKKVDKKVGEYEYFLVQADLDATSTILLSDRKPRQFALHLLDAQTLIVASEAPLVKFLEDNRQPQRLSEPPAIPEREQDPDKGTDGKGGGPKPPGSGMAGAVGGPGSGMTGAAGGPFPPGAGMAGAAGGSFPPKGGMGGASGGGPPPVNPGVGDVGGAPVPPGPGNAGGPPMPPGSFPPRPGVGGGKAPAPAGSASYLTINPALKSMLDKLTLSEKEPGLVLGAANGQNAEALLRDKYVKLTGLDLSQLAVTYLRDVQVVGFIVKSFSESKTSFTIGMDSKSDQLAKDMKDNLDKRLPEIAKATSDWLEIQVTTGSSSGTTGPGRPPFGGGMMGMYGQMGMAGAYGVYGGGQPPGSGGGPPFPPGSGNGPPTPPGGGAAGGPFPPGSGSGPPSPPGGAIGGPIPPGGAIGGRFPPGGGGPFPPGSGGPGGKPPEETSTIGLSRIENTILFSVNLLWKKSEFTPSLQDAVLHMKGHADMVGGKSRIHDLAFALHSYAQQTGHFPRGTAERKSTTERGNLPFRPDQRVSWMAELLPYLGQGEFRSLKNSIDEQQSWRYLPSKDNKDAKNNCVVAQTLIPYFLSNASPETTWWVKYPGLDHEVASTHFVGIAGIGLDAASYDARDPTVAEKLGIFGYDRVTRLEEIKNGLDKTIALLQVPTDVKTCWLAGGGSTIRGVPEIDPIQPFICAEYKGKPGTFAIMGDGKVRFIAKGMNPKIFMGMCTIRGGEQIGDLDEIAPVVQGGEAVLKPELPPGVKPPVDNTPKPPVEETKPLEGVKPPAGGVNPPGEGKLPIKGIPVPPPPGAPVPPGKP